MMGSGHVFRTACDSNEARLSNLVVSPTAHGAEKESGR